MSVIDVDRDDDDDDDDDDGGGGGNDDADVVNTTDSSSVACAILNIASITSTGPDINMYTWYHSP